MQYHDRSTGNRRQDRSEGIRSFFWVLLGEIFVNTNENDLHLRLGVFILRP